MKVYLNLAVPRNRRERYSLAWTVPTLVVSLLVLVWLGVSAVHHLRRSHQIQQSLAKVKAQDAKVQAKEIQLQQQIQRPQFQNMIQETEFVNQLISQKQFSLTRLAFKVSKLLPPSARLNGLALTSSSATNPEVQFAVMGKSEEDIETFLDNLENSSDFNGILIKSQGFRAGSGNGPKEVALICTAKYVAGTQTASDK
ncbi:MAG: hypothetical protein P8Z30_03180 [Acidobacteriota bacterium]